MIRQFAIQAAGPRNASSISVSSSSTSSTSSLTPVSSQSKNGTEDTIETSLSSDSVRVGSDFLVEPRPNVRRYLLFCADSGEFRTSLENIDLTNILDDAVLWDKARESYARIRLKRTRNLSGMLQILLSRPKQLRFLKESTSNPFIFFVSKPPAVGY